MHGMNRLLLSIDDAARLLPFTKNAIYKLISRERIPYKRIGRRVVLDPHELAKWISEMEPGNSKEASDVENTD